MKILNVYAIALIGHHSGPGNWGPLGMNANDNDNDDVSYKEQRGFFALILIKHARATIFCSRELQRNN